MSQPIFRQASGQINVTFQPISQTSADAIQEGVPDRHAIHRYQEHQVIQRIMHRLDHLIGLDHIKRLVYQIYAWIYMNKARSKAGLKSSQQTMHMIFKGNPGTGKTTVARILGELFREMEILSKGELIEVERADLVGEYIGHTAKKTRDLVHDSLGNILFIDEAYSLCRGGEKDFGREAIDTLVKGMEDHRNEFVLILAGYDQEMEDFLLSNPGLPSRFPVQMTFPNYTLSQLLAISDYMADEGEYRFSPQARQTLRMHLNHRTESRVVPFSNGRYIRNLLERAIRHQAVRLMNDTNWSTEQLMMISAQDVLSATCEGKEIW